MKPTSRGPAGLRRRQSWSAELEASSWSCGRRQSSAGSRGKADFFHRLPEPPQAPTPALLDTRTHTPSPITEAHTLALGTKQASALESRRVGTRAMECGDTFRRLIGSRRQPLNSSFASAHHNPPRSPSPESAGKPCVPWALQPGSLEVRRCLPAPAAREGKSNRESAGTQGARGATNYRRAAASEIQGAKV